MALSASDLKFLYSCAQDDPTVAGTCASQDVDGTPDSSLGGCPARNEIPDATLHNLFDVVTGDETASGDTEYRCMFLKNDNTSGETAYNTRIYISQDTTSPDTEIDIGVLGPWADLDTACQNNPIIANEDTAPSGVTFSHPTEASPINVGDVAAGAYVAIWVRWTVNAGASAYDNDTCTIAVKADSSA